MKAIFVHGNDSGSVVPVALVVVVILFSICMTFRIYTQILAKSAENLENKFITRIESNNSDVKKNYEIH